MNYINHISSKNLLLKPFKYIFKNSTQKMYFLKLRDQIDLFLKTRKLKMYIFKT